MAQKKDEIKVQFSEEYSEHIEYEDKVPEGMTEEDIIDKYGKVVWCEFKDCFWNQRVPDLQKTWGTINGNPNYKPIGSNVSEAVFTRICSRPSEIVLRFRTIKGVTGAKAKVPYCYTAADNGNTGHMDFSKLLQSDGTPLGGNISSTNVSLDPNHPGRGYYNLPSGREKIRKYK